MINNSDISVVVQGPVQALADRPMDEGITARALKSIRQHLPGATIILSTWEGQPVEGLDYDELVLSADPGPNINRYRRDGTPDRVNNNRQIVSTLNGLKRVTTRYAMKLRSDNFLVGDQFKALQQKFGARNERCRFLQERVVVNNTFTREYAKGLPVVFHACDFFHFGLTRDVIALWDFPLFEDLPYNPRQAGREQHEGFPYYMPDCTQNLWLAALGQFDAGLAIEHLHQLTPRLKHLSDLCYANNLVVGEPEVIGLGLNAKFSGRERANRTGSLITYLHHLGWQRLYRRHCAPDHPIPGDWADRVRIGVLRGLLLPPKWLEGRMRLRKKVRNSLA